MTTRRQASLYLKSHPEIEQLRRRFNPAQADLIPAHVTLCREDEVPDWNALEHQLRELGSIFVSIEFGAPVREGDFVYLPVVGSTTSFDDLRNQLIGRHGNRPRKHSPHLTLIHPRNGHCTDQVYEEILAVAHPFQTSFHLVSLIEQQDGLAWRAWATVGA